MRSERRLSRRWDGSGVKWEDSGQEVKNMEMIVEDELQEYVATRSDKSSQI